MASVISSAILRTQSDERLVALSRTGHQRAFEAIVERYRAELTRSLRRLLPSGSVEDALQQTHLQAWKALSGGTDVRELRAWLHQIARNAAVRAASRGYDYDELSDALLVTPGPEADLERREAVRRALRGIAELPERQRDALLAVAVGGRSHAEIALDLGITDTAARQLVRRARVSLLALASVATPPQLVRWAARAGHSMVAGKAVAGTGIGGGLGSSAIKVGAVAVAVGGVAAGVVPTHHPPVRSAHVRHHHRHTAASAAPIHLAAVAAPVRAPSPARPPSTTRPALAVLLPIPVQNHIRHHVRQVPAGAIGKTTAPAPAATPLAPPPTPPTPPPPPPAPASAAAAAPANPAAAAVAVLAALWYARQTQRLAVSADHQTPAAHCGAWPRGQTGCDRVAAGPPGAGPLPGAR